MDGPAELLAILQENSGRVLSAGDLARRLGVTTRTVRNYVKANNQVTPGLIMSSHAGYQISSAGRGDTSALERERAPRTPAERLIHVTRTLITSDEAIDFYGLAESLYVSDSTLEADLVKVRATLEQFGLKMLRNRHLLSISGPEAARRRLMRRILIDAAASGRPFVTADELADQLGEPAIRDLKHRLLVLLEEEGFNLNDASADDLVAHIAIMVDRIRSGHPVEGLEGEPDPSVARTVERITRLVREIFATELTQQELRYVSLLLVQKATPIDVPIAERPEMAVFFQDNYVQMVHEIVQEVNDNYLIDLGTERFIAFLGLHVRNLVQRASNNEVVKMRSAQSVKGTHPLIYELAVFIARQIEQRAGVSVAEEEIGLISFHVAAQLLKMYEREQRVSVSLVVPRYYDVHLALQQSVDQAIAGLGAVDEVITSIDHDWSQSQADLIVATAPLSGQPYATVLPIPALPGDEDLERVRAAAKRLADQQRRSRVTATLSRLFDPNLFFHVQGGTSRDEVLAMLAAALEHEGLVAPGYLELVQVRERLSPTSFPSGAAIPHAMEMRALRSGLAVCIGQESFDWDGSPVDLVVMFAFSPESRGSFGKIFDHFIHALVNRANVEKLVRDGASYEGFMQSLLELM